MSSSNSLRFLRPYLCKELPAARKSAYLRFFSSTRCRFDGADSRKISDELKAEGIPDWNRAQRLESAELLKWPRLERNASALSTKEFNSRYKTLSPSESAKDSVTVRGRVVKVRLLGKGLVFLDIIEDGYTVQGMVNLKALETPLSAQKDFERLRYMCRVGDIVSIRGLPYMPARAKTPSINCDEIPQFLSPTLHITPDTVEDKETRIRNRHVDLLVNANAIHVIKARSHITQSIRNFLLNDEFIEVQTPMIADIAGGAIARSFKTNATEFPDKQLALRIAPELWLKRLIIGGVARVFEIGPAFRNEGIDATHNPEFTTCEFYKSFAELEELIGMTEQMITGIAGTIENLRAGPLSTLPEIPENLRAAPFQRIEFIPAIEEALGVKLPDLAADDATLKLVSLFEQNCIPIPISPTLPRLLDRLGTIFIEPRCEAPTFIMYHPACMAPLSKSFYHAGVNQYVSARAELFIQEREIANMYEEENSPLEQRTKMELQARYRDAENDAHVDQNYIEALEWGLPPTGGWGCGVDRLVMLFTGCTRIADVLPFGNLRNVVNLGSPASRTATSRSSLNDI